MKKFKRGDVIMANDGMNQYGFTNQHNLFLAVVNRTSDPEDPDDDYITVDSLVLFYKNKPYHLFHYFTFPDTWPTSFPRPFTLTSAFEASNLDESKEERFLQGFYGIRIQNYSVRAKHFRLYSREAYERDIQQHFSSRLGYKKEQLSLFLDALDHRLKHPPTPIPSPPPFSLL